MAVVVILVAIVGGAALRMAIPLDRAKSLGKFLIRTKNINRITVEFIKLIKKSSHCLLALFHQFGKRLEKEII